MMPMAYDIGNTTSLNVSCKVGATILVCDLCWTPKFKTIPPMWTVLMELVLLKNSELCEIMF